MYLKCFLSISLATVETKMQRKIYLFNESVQSKNVKLMQDRFSLKAVQKVKNPG